MSPLKKKIWHATCCEETDHCFHFCLILSHSKEMRFPKFTCCFPEAREGEGPSLVRNSGQAEAGHSGVLVGGVRTI